MISIGMGEGVGTGRAIPLKAKFICKLSEFPLPRLRERAEGEGKGSEQISIARC